MARPEPPTDGIDLGTARCRSFLRSYLAHPSVVSKLERLAAGLDGSGDAQEGSLIGVRPISQGFEADGSSGMRHG